MIVDDEQDVRSLIESVLKGENYSVVEADSGSGAVEMLRSNNTDVVLLDMMMPGMDGLETAEAIRKFSDVPIIVVSIKANELGEEIANKYNFSAMIQKPFQSQELLTSINDVLNV